jgi:hypothetical protein
VLTGPNPASDGVVKSLGGDSGSGSGQSDICVVGNGVGVSDGVVTVLDPGLAKIAAEVEEVKAKLLKVENKIDAIADKQVALTKLDVMLKNIYASPNTYNERESMVRGVFKDFNGIDSFVLIVRASTIEVAIEKLEEEKKDLKKEKDKLDAEKMALMDEKNKLLAKENKLLDIQSKSIDKTAGSSVWLPAPDAQIWLDELINCKPEPLGSNVLAYTTKHKCCFFPDNNLTSIFIREQPREVWDAVYSSIFSPAAKQGLSSHKAVIIGNPGIGKSTSMVYLVLKAAEEKRNIMWHDVKGSRAYYFEYDKNTRKYVANMNEQLVIHGGRLNDSATLFLVDPGPAESSKLLSVPAATVVASSPDARHYSEFVKTDVPQFYMNVWSLEELFACHKILGVKKSLIKERHAKIGGLLRQICMNPESFENYLISVNSAIENATKDHLLKLLDFSNQTDSKMLTKLYKMVPDQLKNNRFFDVMCLSDQIETKFAKKRADLIFYVIKRASSEAAGIIGRLFETTFLLNFSNDSETTLKATLKANIKSIINKENEQKDVVFDFVKAKPGNVILNHWNKADPFVLKPKNPENFLMQWESDLSKNLSLPGWKNSPVFDFATRVDGTTVLWQVTTAASHLVYPSRDKIELINTIFGDDYSFCFLTPREKVTPTVLNDVANEINTLQKHNRLFCLTMSVEDTTTL